MPRSHALRRLHELFLCHTVATLPEIEETLGGVSHMTVFRLLREVPYRRSYNCNGRYYAAFDPARFDRFGLWRFREIRFSTDGSLKATVRRMVLEAQAGLIHPELAERLGVRVHNTLLALTRAAAIARQELAGGFVYLHPDPARGEAQLRHRRERASATAAARAVELSDRVVIAVLLALLRAPGGLGGRRSAWPTRPRAPHFRGPGPGGVRALRPRGPRGKRGPLAQLSVLRRLLRPLGGPEAGTGAHSASIRPRVDFAPETELCPSCRADLQVQKIHTRTVVTLAHGAFQAREITKQCATSPAAHPTVRSSALARLVKPRHRYGYDLVVHAGLARYLHAQQREEIRTELREAHDIDLASGTVSGLCDRFLLGLEALHGSSRVASDVTILAESSNPLHGTNRRQTGTDGEDA
jgi:hypothetical protein